MGNKISEKLFEIINNKITHIELPNPTLTEVQKVISIDEKDKEINVEEAKSINSIPVSYEGYIPVIVNFTDFDSMKSNEVKAILNDVNIKSEYSIIPAVAANLNVEQINQLAQLSQVDLLEFDDFVVMTLDTARKWFGVDEVVKTFGVTGNEGNPKVFNKSDNVIAILDTGIDINHVDLGSGKVIGWRDEINPGTTVPYDDNGHGTHVSSIAAGLGKAIWDYRGVAYGSALVGVKVLNSNGIGTLSQVINGVQWCILNKNVFGIKVINMSLIGGSNLALRLVVTAAVANGIVVVCAAGNSGPSLGTIGSPGDALAVITVGNMADVGQGGYFLVNTSGRGPVNNGAIKPDLVAPGFNITAAKAGTTNQYTTYSGTSMATPFVSGVVALMLDANNKLTPSQVKDILTSTTQKWDGFTPNNDYGYGRLQAFDALKKVCKMYGSKCKSCHDHKCDDDHDNKNCEKHEDGCCWNSCWECRCNDSNCMFCCKPCNCCCNPCCKNEHDKCDRHDKCNEHDKCDRHDKYDKYDRYKMYNMYDEYDEYDKYHKHDKCEKQDDCHKHECHKKLKQPSHLKASGTIDTSYRSDWYEFYVTELGFPVGITLLTTSPVPPTDSDLYVYDRNFNQIASSISSSRQDTVSFIPNYLGKYLIKVYRYSSTTVSYNLDVSTFGTDLRLYEKTN